jgi:hypothetical protein
MKLESKIATCHPDKLALYKGLCASCYYRYHKEKVFERSLPQLLEDFKNQDPEYYYSKLPTENIPDLKKDPYWLSLGDARKLPKLLTV